MTEGGGGVILGGDINNPNNVCFTTLELTTTTYTHTVDNNNNNLINFQASIARRSNSLDPTASNQLDTRDNTTCYSRCQRKLGAFWVSRNASTATEITTHTGGAGMHQIHVVGAQNNVFNRFVLKFL